MPRIRTIKPEFWTDSKVVRLSLEARLLFIGSWNFADDYGCLQADPMELKLRVLPLEDTDAEEVVDELVSGGLFEILETSGGLRFWHITNWNRHQRVSHPKDSDYGAPDTWRKAVTRGNPEPSRDNGKAPEDSGGFMGEGKGREGKGKEGILAPQPAHEPIPNDAEHIDALKAVLVEICGEPPPKQWSVYQRVATWIRDNGGTAGELRWKAGRLAGEWGMKAVTVTSIEKYWTRYDAQVGQLTDADVSRSMAEIERGQLRRQILEAADDRD